VIGRAGGDLDRCHLRYVPIDRAQRVEAETMVVRPEADISPALVTVEPGQQAHVTMRVRNTGPELAHYSITLVEHCVAAPWTVVTPPEISLWPGDDGEVVVVFAPPVDSATPSGSFPYAVRVLPAEEEQQPVVVEGDVVVGAIHALDVSIVPKTSHGRWRGRHRVVVSNAGSDAVQVRLVASDDDEALAFALAPTTVSVPPGGQAEAHLKVRPRSPSVFGKAVVRPFHVTYRRRSGAKVTLGGAGAAELDASTDASYEQRPWCSKLVVALVVLAVVGVGMLVWSLTRPGPEPLAGPPDPPERFSAAPVGGDPPRLELFIVGRPGHETFEFREVACDTETQIRPQQIDAIVPLEGAVGELRRRVEWALEPGEHCLQARAVNAAGSPSVWFPVGSAARVDVPADCVVAPTITKAEPAGEGRVEVEWTENEECAGRDIAYFGYVDGANEQELLASPATLEVGPGPHEIVIAAQADGELHQSAPFPYEAPVDTTVPDGTTGSETTTTSVAAPPPPAGWWLIFTPNGIDPADPGDIEEVGGWATVARDLDLDPPTQRTVGRDVRIETVGFNFADGDVVLIIEGFVDEATARTTCQQFNQRAYDLAGQGAIANTCAVVNPEGELVVTGELLPTETTATTATPTTATAAPPTTATAAPAAVTP
jgi:hypothetical protein